ncbi:hypothetical protein [Streptomyces sp. NPDC058108]|uniref:hypothetical protein n=1 Tax=Streptomyces sp. NPDC058108 TaxID=3346344 RepID=UPI0036EAB322
MKWILLGAVLGLLLVYPSLLTLAAAVVAAVASKPAAAAFILGLLARPHLRRWAR